MHFPPFFSLYCWRKQLFSSSLFFPSSVCSSPFPFSGGFSETYAALCDYNGISCKEEVQWVRAVGLCLCYCECVWMLHIYDCAQYEGGGHALMDNVSPRMWTPSITLRTTGSLTCWTSATWRAGQDRMAVGQYCSQITVPHLSSFSLLQRFGCHCCINGLQHLVH